MLIEIPLKTVSALNAREHSMARHRRVSKEREATAWALAGKKRPALPCQVTLTRVGPTRGLDSFDNLPSALKGCVDQIAEWIGVNDREDDRVRYVCKQERAPRWFVRVEFEPMEKLPVGRE